MNTFCRLLTLKALLLIGLLGPFLASACNPTKDLDADKPSEIKSITRKNTKERPNTQSAGAADNQSELSNNNVNSGLQNNDQQKLYNLMPTQKTRLSSPQIMGGFLLKLRQLGVRLWSK